MRDISARGRPDGEPARRAVADDRRPDGRRHGRCGGRPESAAAALCALLHFLDRPSVDLLRQVLGLTSSGTVRLVDRMTESGYVERGPGSDGRSTSVTLTPAGRAAARRVAAARASVLEGALAGLPAADRAALRPILGTMLRISGNMDLSTVLGRRAAGVCGGDMRGTYRGRVSWLSRTAGRPVAAASVLVAALTTVTGVLPAGPGPAARADDVTASQDPLRTGWDPAEPGLSPGA